jgi:hypothetical protein
VSVPLISDGSMLTTRRMLVRLSDASWCHIPVVLNHWKHKKVTAQLNTFIMCQFLVSDLNKYYKQYFNLIYKQMNLVQNQY